MPPAVSEQFRAASAVALASAHEQLVLIFQQRSISHRPGRDDVRAIPAVAAEHRGAVAERGAISGFIEIHHVSPLHTLKPGSQTRLQDLAVPCANCHRMVHAKPKWLTLSELRALLAEQGHTFGSAEHRVETM